MEKARSFRVYLPLSLNVPPGSRATPVKTSAWDETSVPTSESRPTTAPLGFPNRIDPAMDLVPWIDLLRLDIDRA